MSPNVKMVSFVADEGRGQRRFANTTVSRHNNPAWFSARASCRGIFHTCMSFNKGVPPAAIIICVFYENIWSHGLTRGVVSCYGNSEAGSQQKIAKRRSGGTAGN